MKKETKDKIKAITIACLGVVSLIGFGIVDARNINNKRKDVKYILDINRDNQLSSEEIKRFYDEMGINPYQENSLYSLPEKDLSRFLEKYR